jgi:protein pelota
VLGPGFAKERFLAYARGKQPEHVKGAAVESTGQAGMAAIHEALKKGLVDRVSKDQRVARESALVERLLELIAKEGAVAYGMGATRHATEVGATEELLLSDRVAREPEGETLMDLARRTGAKVHVVSSLHDAGKSFDALGGVGALLRYRIEGA